MHHTNQHQAPDRPAHSSPRSRTEDNSVASIPVNQPVTNSVSPLICTVCGREHKGQMRGGCNGPDQKFVTPEQYAAMRRPLVRPYVDSQTFKARCEAARERSRENGRIVNALHDALYAVRQIPVTSKTETLRAAAYRALSELLDERTRA